MRKSRDREEEELFGADGLMRKASPKALGSQHMSFPRTASSLKLLLLLYQYKYCSYFFSFSICLQISLQRSVQFSRITWKDSLGKKKKDHELTDHQRI